MLQVARAGLWIAIMLTLAPLRVQAQEPSQARSVHVRIAAADEERVQLERVLLELMQRLSVELEVTDAGVRAPAGAAYVARAFIDLRDSSEAALYVHDPARDRVLERRVTRTQGGQELLREELGHMVLAAVEALLAGADVGAPSAEVPEAAAHVVPAPSPTPAPINVPPPSVQDGEPDTEKSTPAWSVRGAILYEIQGLGHGPGVAHGPVIAADIGLPWSWPLGLMLSAQYRFPFEIEPDPVGMRTQTFALRALPVAQLPLSAVSALRFGLGAGADVTRIEPERSGDRFETSARRTLVLAVGRALAGVDLRLSPVLSLRAAVAADIDLDRARYVLESDGRESTITEPWRVRPALWLGAALP